LLRENKFTAREILPGLRQQNRDLQRENALAIEVLMKTIEIAWAILQQ